MNDTGLLDHPFPLLTREQFNNLSKPFSPKEVWNALNCMNPYKSSRARWVPGSILPTPFVLGVLKCQARSKTMNQTILTLIPKVENPQCITQFGPICLCNVTYKLVTNSIVEQLKETLISVISTTQASFVPKRQISDNVVLMQEVLHTMRHKKGAKGYMAIEIDFQKAYDWVNWSFLKDTLMLM